MNFNYRDFFIHNDDLHIIKEQLSIVDEMVSRQHALSTNAKAVWDMYNMYKKEQSGTDGSSGSSGSSGTSGTDGSSGSNEQNIEQKIADKLEINVETVKKIIQICLMNTIENKNLNTISKKLDINHPTVFNVLKNAIGSERKRQKDLHFVNDAVKIVDMAKKQMTEKDKKIDPDEIVNLINNGKEEDYEKIDLNKVNLVLKIVDMATKQMTEKGEVYIQKIYQEIDKKISYSTIIKLIKALNLGETRYKHRFTEEQDAFILYLYLQRNGPTEIARKFNKKFKDSEENALNILPTSILKRLITVISKPKGESETHYVLDLLDKYKTEYFSTVDINDPKTKALLTHYTAPETIKGRDTTGTGTNRDMSAHLGTLPKNFNTMITNLVR